MLVLGQLCVETEGAQLLLYSDRVAYSDYQVVKGGYVCEFGQ